MNDLTPASSARREEWRRRQGRRWLEADARERAEVSGQWALHYRDWAIEYLQHENERLRRQLVAQKTDALRAEEKRLRKELDEEVKRLRAEIASLCSVPGIKEVVRLVAQAAQVPVQEVMARGRRHEAVRVRQVVWWLLRRLKPQMSLPTLGAIFGRDHTTVLSGLEQVERNEESLQLARRVAEEMGVHECIEWPILEEQR